MFIESYGCTTNLGDARTMGGILAAAGHRIVETESEADLVLVNTCTVVDTTEQRIRHRLGSHQDEGRRLVVTGCMAAAQPEVLERLVPDAPLVGPRDLQTIAEVVQRRWGPDRSTEPTAPAATPPPAPKTRLPRLLGNDGTDAIIQVAEGCLFSCSYCLTKRARGDQTSHTEDGIVADVRDAVNAGAIEIRLTAQDTSGYGVDDGRSLASLLHRITGIGGDFRVRVGMMHPRTAVRDLDALLDAMDHEKVYRFLHLPIQTGSPALLRRMRRGHAMDEFWRVVEAFGARFPDGLVSTDLIVGHPGETEEDHQATLRLVERLRAGHVNVTRYSARPHTASKSMSDRVPSQVQKRRSRELSETARTHIQRHYDARVGRVETVHVLEDGKIPGTMLARSPSHEPVAIHRGAEALPIGTRVDVAYVQAGPTYLVGEPVSAPVRISKATRTRPA